MALNIKIEKRETGACLVALDGRLDATTYLSLEEKMNALLGPNTKALMLDLGKLSYISSAGVRVILKARKAIAASRGAFLMLNLQPQIRKVFEVVNALPNTPIFESIEEADRYLDAVQKEEIEKQGRLPGQK